MEKWQVDYIKANLQELINSTECNTQLLAFLESKNVLSDEDADTINCENGRHKKARILYQLLQNRDNSYEVLIKALLETKQSGAAKILRNITKKNLEEPIGCLEVLFLGKTHQLRNLLTSAEVQETQNWIQKNVSLDQRLKLLKAPLQLLRNSIPARDPLYIPRLLSRRQAINPEIFGKKCADIFVFKSIDRYKLREFNESDEIAFSVELLLKRKVHCRLILLSLDAHWKILTSNSRLTGPAHLIRYESETNEFVLEETTGGSDILHHHLEQTSDCIDLSETDFIETTQSEEIKGICICDSPGMGKSLLLASIARNLAQKCPNKIIAFIQLKDFQAKSCRQATTRSLILEHLSTSQLALRILEILTSSTRTNFELFFDGLDEVQQEDFEAIKAFLSKIRNDMPEARIYITSRPVVRKELEETTKALSYNTRPFNEANQVNSLVSVWNQKSKAADKDILCSFAHTCLQNLERFYNINDKHIAGVPLLCKMIAEVTSDDAIAFANSGHIYTKYGLQSAEISLLDIYRKYMERLLGNNKCGYSCMKRTQNTGPPCNISCKVKSYHVIHAFKLIYPELRKLVLEEFASFEELHHFQTLRPGVLKPEEMKYGKVEFVHRTFAEYLIAEYLMEVTFAKVLCAKKQSSPAVWRWAYYTFLKTPVEHKIMREFVKCRENVVLYFVNAFLGHNCQQYSHIFPGIKALPNDTFSKAVLNCVRQNYERVLEVVLKLQTESKFSVVNYRRSKVNKGAAFNILLTAAKFSDSTAIKTLDQFYTEYYNFRLLKNIRKLDKAYMNIIKQVIRRADYEVAILFVDKVSLKGHDLLTHCLEYTYFESIEMVEKRIDIARLLLSRCPELNAANFTVELGTTPPILASEIHPKAIKFLVENGANILKTDIRSNETFLHKVARYMSEAEIVELCRSAFFKRSVEDLFFVFAQRIKFKFPFRRARALTRVLSVINPEVPIVSEEQLEMFWNDAISKNEDCVTSVELPPLYRLSSNSIAFEYLLFVAVEEGDIPVAEWLISHDNTLLETKNVIGQTPMLMAVDRKQIEIFIFFVLKSANIFALDNNGRTILHIAAKTKDREVFHRVVELLKSLSDPTATQNAFGLKTCTSTEKFPSTFQELFNWRDNWSHTPLHCICFYLDLPLETINLLLDCDQVPTRPQNSKNYTVDLNATDVQGRTALTLALLNGRSLEFVQHLVARGANWTTKDNNNCNVAFTCAKKGMFEHLKFFVELGCNVNETDNSGENTLQKFVFYKEKHMSVELVQYLLSVGADKRNKNKLGQTAYDIAVWRGCSLEVLKLLKSPHEKKFPAVEFRRYVSV